MIRPTQLADDSFGWIVPNRGETRSYCLYLMNKVFTAQVVQSLKRDLVGKLKKLVV